MSYTSLVLDDISLLKLDRFHLGFKKHNKDLQSSIYPNQKKILQN